MAFFFPNLADLPNRELTYLHDGTWSGRSLLAAGAETSFQLSRSDTGRLDEMQAFIDAHRGKWMIIALSYELKDHIERLTTSHQDPVGFPMVHIYVPQTLLSLEKGRICTVQQHSANAEETLREAIQTSFRELPPVVVELTPRLSQQDYLDDIRRMQDHIQRGDIYEVNYCQEFFTETTDFHPFATYRKLHHLTRAPFSAFHRCGSSYLLCASPERYLKREGHTVISQPIKGTIRRGRTPQEDQALVEQLRNDPKERSENIMITDLVRNDFSRSAIPGSVVVEELCGIHSFETVHQMISTVRATLPEGVSFTQLIRDTFPMGSMTGAPKVSAMKLIDRYERSARGLYSGTVGYIDPAGNTDLNVVIRSLLYNASSGYLAARVGGAITAASVPENEYEECLLKADALFNAIR